MTDLRERLIFVTDLRRREQRAIQRRCQRGELFRLRAGIYIPADSYHRARPWEKFEVAALAAGMARPSNVLVGKAAAAVWGVPFGEIPDSVELGGNPGAAEHRDPGLTFRSLVPLPELPPHRLRAPFSAVRVTSLAQTLLDLPRWHGVATGVIALDHCLHHHRIHRARLEGLLPEFAGRHGISQAQRSLQLAHPAAESPRESALRIRMWEAGLPAPHVQAVICDERGTQLGRTDFFYPDHSLGVEYDGQAKYQAAFGLSPEQAALDEMRRHREFANAGLRLVRVTSETLREGTWLADLRRALAWGRRSGQPFPARQWSSAGLAWQRSKRRPSRTI